MHSSVDVRSRCCLDCGRWKLRFGGRSPGCCPSCDGVQVGSRESKLLLPCARGVHWARRSLAYNRQPRGGGADSAREIDAGTTSSIMDAKPDWAVLAGHGKPHDGGVALGGGDKTAAPRIAAGAMLRSTVVHPPMADLAAGVDFRISESKQVLFRVAGVPSADAVKS